MIIQTIIHNPVKLRPIVSLTQPSAGRPGDVWIKTSSPVTKVLLLNSINPDGEQQFDNNSAYLYSEDASGVMESINYKLYDFGNNLKIYSNLACSVVVGAGGLQIIADVYIYIADSAEWMQINTLQLPLILSDYLSLEKFFVAEVPSLFDALGIAEELSIEAAIQEALEPLHLESIFGADVTGLFENLGIAEQLIIMSGGNQIYP